MKSLKTNALPRSGENSKAKSNYKKSAIESIAKKNNKVEV